MTRFDYVIIGNSAAGVGGVEGIRRFDAKGSIAVIGDEDVMPYCRCLLPKFIGGAVTERSLTYRPFEFFERNRVSLLLGRRAVSLDLGPKEVLLDDGSRVGYRSLLLATGSSAVLLELPGRELPGVHVLRTLSDAEAIMEDADAAKAAVVMGGGLVGIRTAIALHQRGLRACLVVASPQVLSQNIDRGAAEVVARHLRENGIDLILGEDVVEVIGPDRVRGARLSDGRVVECGLVLSAKGVRPNSELASAAGIEVDRGVVVDERMGTSAPGVYAAGDVAEAKEFVSGQGRVMTIWPVAAEQGRVAGANMAGGDVPYPGGVMMNTADLFGLPVVSIGESREPREGQAPEVLVERDDAKKRYRKVVLREGRIVGAILVGDLGQAGGFTGMPCTRVDMSSVRKLLLREGFDYAKLVDALLVKGPASPTG